MLSGVFEEQAGTDDEVLHRARDEDLPWPGQRSDPCSNDNRETTDMVP